MGIERSSFEIAITTTSELAGANQIAASLEKQIMLAKLNGQEFGALEAQLVKVRESVKRFQEATGEAGHEVELFTTHGKAFHKLMHEANQIAPGLGMALRAAFSPHALGIYAIVGVMGSMIEKMEESKKAMEEFKTVMAEGLDVEGFRSGGKELQTSMAESAASAEAFARALEAIADAQATIKQKTDEAVNAIHEQAKADQAVADAKKKAEEAQIKADAATGKISKEQEIAALAALEGKSTEEKTARTRKTRQAEIEEREKELKATEKAAQDAAAKEHEIEGPATARTLAPARRKKLLEQLEANIKAAEERDKKITEQIGEPGIANEKVEWADQVPWNEKWATGRAQIASDQKAIEQFKRQQKQLEEPEYEAKVVGSAKAAEEELRQARETATKLQERVKELEKDIAEKKKADERDFKTETQVGGYEEKARKTTADSEVTAERQREAKQINEDVKRLDTLEHKPVQSEEDVREIQNLKEEVRTLLGKLRVSKSETTTILELMQMLVGHVENHDDVLGALTTRVNRLASTAKVTRD